MLSLVALVCVSIYYVELAEREYYGNYLRAIDKTVIKLYKGAKNSEKKAAIVRRLSPICREVQKKIDHLHGTWKKMHIVYQVMARVSLFQGQVADAMGYLKTSIHYHPYYANAYKMLAGLWKVMGRADKGKTCQKVAKDILEGRKPSRSDLDLCTSCAEHKKPSRP